MSAEKPDAEKEAKKRLRQQENPEKLNERLQNESDQPRYRWVTHEEMMPMIEKIIAENFESFKRLTDDEKYRG
jgi:anaerobic ribonucleoside-triphosphate reductase